MQRAFGGAVRCGGHALTLPADRWYSFVWTFPPPLLWLTDSTDVHIVADAFQPPRVIFATAPFRVFRREECLETSRGASGIALNSFEFSLAEVIDVCF